MDSLGRLFAHKKQHNFSQFCYQVDQYMSTGGMGGLSLGSYGRDQRYLLHIHTYVKVNMVKM